MTIFAFIDVLAAWLVRLIGLGALFILACLIYWRVVGEFLRFIKVHDMMMRWAYEKAVDKRIAKGRGKADA